MGSKVVKTALDKNPLLKAKAENFAKNAFESIKENLQNAKLDKNTRKALESIFNKELIKALDNRAFIVGDEALNKIKYAIIKGEIKKGDLINLSKINEIKVNKVEKMNIDEFLNDKGEVDYIKLEKIAIDLPSSLNYKKFLVQFENNDKVIIKTPIKDLQVNPKYMFYHLTKNGDTKGKFKGNNKENRVYISGGVLETLKNPLFITQDTQETFYFYKAFKNKHNKLVNLISLAVPKNNLQMIYKTSYNGSNKRMIDLIKKHKLIYKVD